MEQAYQQHSDAEAYQNDTGSHDQMSAEEENNMSDSNYEETTEVMELKPVVEGCNFCLLIYLNWCTTRSILSNREGCIKLRRMVLKSTSGRGLVSCRF